MRQTFTAALLLLVIAILARSGPVTVVVAGKDDRGPAVHGNPVSGSSTYDRAAPLHQLVGYRQTGPVKLTTLTKKTYIPGFMERDKGQCELPFEEYPWYGISGTRPIHEFAKTTTVGVY
jgi:hypothetical protein